ncbi:MAG: ArsR family transcriptional regulator [Verrucomicrobia bacterium]|nr:ArsR family transcriptional regulator [Verrucomicrobiota bacterium]
MSTPGAPNLYSPEDSPLSPAQLGEVAALFKLLSETTRLRILQAVCKGPRSVNEIVELAESTQANVSKHLALLTSGGILQRERDGQKVFYSVKAPLALRMCELVRANWLK